jgi:N6-L-threonylcarbamoyladenine synthase
VMILAIESTCDETAAAVIKKTKLGFEIVSNVTASSAQITSKYGGIVPEVVAREQVSAIVPVINEAMSSVNIDEIDSVAVAYGPGLVGSLLIGVEAARTFAWAKNKPIIRVNHLVAHVFANWLGDEPPELPAIAIIVSGGHTDLVLLNSLNDWKWVGGTRDDAAGEAFDKAARAMGLPYPGGPSIQKAIEEWTIRGSVKNQIIKLPRPMINENNLEMSFSGLKTALVDLMVKLPNDIETVGNLAYEFNEAVVEVLISKTERAALLYQPKSIILAGGVAANSRLRSNLKTKCEELNMKFFVPEMRFCGDNAAMIGVAGLLRKDDINPLELEADSGLGVV